MMGDEERAMREELERQLRALLERGAAVAETAVAQSRHLLADEARHAIGHACCPHCAGRPNGDHANFCPAFTPDGAVK